MTDQLSQLAGPGDLACLMWREWLAGGTPAGG